jgi:hypothetical protein
MLISAISAIGIPRELHACNNNAAVDRQEFEAALKLPSREGFTNRDRLTDNELGVLHKRGLISNTYKSLKTLFYAIIIPTIIGCPAYTRGNIFWCDNYYA